MLSKLFVIYSFVVKLITNNIGNSTLNHKEVRIKVQQLVSIVAKIHNYVHFKMRRRVLCYRRRLFDKIWYISTSNQNKRHVLCHSYHCPVWKGKRHLQCFMILWFSFYISKTVVPKLFCWKTQLSFFGRPHFWTDW